MNKTSGPSLFGRAVTALLLTIGFYSLAIGIALGLLYLIYLEVVVVGRINIRLTIFALIGAVVILWSILPRVDRFIQPGPRMTKNKFPLLFKQIEKIAARIKQEMPREVYLVPDVNAFVAERGGFMGIGTRRVMGIGLPLFHMMTIDELNAILAHEFGHYYGGDTALGPWIYKTREAIIRTTVNMGKANQWLYFLFEAYAKMFLRVTNAVSRQQEFTSDRLAAQLFGSKTTISGLQKVHKYGEAFGAYFQQEYAPVIDAGYYPPLMEGFKTFLKAPKIMEIVDTGYKKQLEEGVTNVYDSHPSLKERITAVSKIPGGEEENKEPALSLLPGNVDLETLILKTIIRQKEKLASLKQISWDEVTETAFAPQWDKSVERFKGAFSEMTVHGLIDEAQNIPRLFDRFDRSGHILPPNVKSRQVPSQTMHQILANVIGAGFAATMKNNGWKIKTDLGHELLLVKNGKEINPYALLPKLSSGEFTRQTWIDFCDENGLSSLKFS